MAYQFRGFFTTPAEGLIASAAARWTGASVRVLHEPFEGVGVRFSDLDSDDSLQQSGVRCEEELPEWSKRFPENTFVYLLVECFGGDCDHFGYACKNGVKIDTVDEEPEEGLIRLMSHLGAKLGTGDSRSYFQPFERGYPW